LFGQTSKFLEANVRRICGMQFATFISLKKKLLASGSCNIYAGSACVILDFRHRFYIIVGNDSVGLQ